MNPLDEKIRERARREDCPVPEGFDRRLQARLAALPEQKRVRPRRLYRGLIAAAAAAALCVAGVAAGPKLVRLAEQGVEGFHNLARQVEPQPFSAEVGASVTDKGYTLKVEGIGVDDAFLTLYYTVTGEAPIPVQDGDPQLLALDLRAEGEELEFWDYDLVTQLEDEHTLRVVQRCPVLAALPDQVELEIYSQELFWRVTGDWSLALTVDKSEPAAKSLVAEPKTVISAEGRKVIVDKVVVAPSGGGIVLTEAGDCPPLEHFVLRDDQGNVLPTKRYGTVSRPILPISNFIEFYGGRTDMESITLIPWIADGESHRVSGGLDDLPLTDEGADNGYTLLSLEVGPTQSTATFQSSGILGESDVYNPEFNLLDREGELADLGRTYLERTREVDTGLWTVTLSYPEAGADQVAQIAGVSFWQPNCMLLEDQAVTIPLTE
ncbi:DUF4179 domain-containing protein [Lawsonibacter celer]|uniref:DUF4179 domain-containing protein n=1 Tax=Lawsonibacter celer TaxID=2986526 RepID=UPI00164558B1|nr:DUF4179 domain-containing protein [Lawsonibacter celer]